jgi:prepilin-type N-terminal cleavage/methylation domain-containing protein
MPDGTRAARGFTLVEVLVALAIMAFGISAAIGLFVLATATHKRALDQTTAALLAETLVSEARSEVTLVFDASRLPLAPGSAAARVLRQDGTHPAYPGYRYDVYVTPVAGPPESADLYLVEVRVRWMSAGQARSADFHGTALRRAAVRDLAPAGP